jgi:hypothetical protein
MLILTEDAFIGCADEPPGRVGLSPLQDWVTINGRKVLVETDLEGRPISNCPNIGIGIKPCTTTLRVEHGYSEFVRVDGHRMCLDTVIGKTDGTPPGVVTYYVRKPGQEFVEGAA